jgi:ABC-type Fe3+/spermidine/putrescine transport system ATPase subunit
LRLIAGLERADDGEIALRDKTIASVQRKVFLPPEKRNLGMVFQSFAVWLHMTVAEHVGFPLMVRRCSKKEILHRVAQALEFVNLYGVENRLATELSGGQQQRLALARALVYDPDILLLDEPLSNLDAKLRRQMRVELKLLQQRLGTTFVFVTHDQLEAMTLAHRVALMSDGCIEQIGDPSEVYDKPATSFVHTFLGTTVSFQGQWVEEGRGKFVQLLGGCRLRPKSSFNGGQVQSSTRVQITVRPSDLQVIEEHREAQENEIEASVESIINLGDEYEVAFKACETEFLLQVPKGLQLQEKQRILLRVNAERLRIWPS